MAEVRLIPLNIWLLCIPVNSKLNGNDNLAAIFKAKLTFKRPSSSVPFYCICRRGRHHFLGMYRDLMFLY